MQEICLEFSVRVSMGVLFDVVCLLHRNAVVSNWLLSSSDAPISDAIFEKTLLIRELYEYAYEDNTAQKYIGHPMLGSLATV